jgi:predicted ATPase/polyhydroxyalkanoate synthesis regulator phasin
MVKMERLRLTAFRGVPGELQLVFTSPFTIIYAPNGMGKSSVIDAAELLLTGAVKRVSDFSKKKGAGELRCKFAPLESRMEVEGWFSQGKEAFRLVRLADAWLKSREGDDAPHRTSSQEVMKLFAPMEFGKEGDSHVVPRLERDWIRSARFLTVSTLALLVDTESQNQAAREAALGGFLGVGELFARADKFETFAGRLNDGYGGEEGLAATKRELARRKEELARLRNAAADAGDKSPEPGEPLLNELYKTLRVLEEKGEDQLTTRPHGDLPERRLAELKVRSALDLLARQKQVHSLEEVVGTIEEKVRNIDRKRDQALEAARLFRDKANRYCAEQLERLFDVVSPMFSRVQANEVFDSLHRGPLDNPFAWVAKSSSFEFNPSPYFSMGQRQDLALAIFLARARGIRGTFFLDEPVIHLDDLNRVALMDTFRMLVLESEPCCNFIMTTARRDFIRHMAEKFANVPPIHGMPPLRIYELDGSPRVGVRVAKEWCAGV